MSKSIQSIGSGINHVALNEEKDVEQSKGQSGSGWRVIYAKTGKGVEEDGEEEGIVVVVVVVMRKVKKRMRKGMMNMMIVM